ncbi:MAG: sulfotransferase domain-containing protein [Gammaproteobacteria bacterium]|nr:sulfotransferase domain-containing protein [Gammaproteobacteria bacterium]MCW8922221.1 sulfotransferase domain-containing protein [Gammaproteobacteria bacterium]
MLLLGYPKSGNTWIAYMISYIFNTVYDDYDAPGIHPKRESIRKYVKGGLLHESFEDKLGRVLKTHKKNIELSDEKVVYIVRDPRDVMVSYFFYKKNVGLNDENMQLDQFIVENLPAWVEHVSAWKGRADAIIRYEDATEMQFDCFLKLCNDLDVSVDESVIKAADDVFSFKNMSNREKGDEDNASFYRKGVVGDWKTYFSASDNEYIESHAGELMRELEY